jgi:hypothetical protein
MYRIIGIDGKEYGPVTVEQLREWIASGRANAQTRARAEDSPEWKTLGGFAEFAEALAAKAAAAAPPPGTPPPFAPPPLAPVPIDADALAAEILARDYHVDIGSCLSRSWDLLMKNFWLVVGVSFVLGLIAGSVGLLAGVCYGGIYFVVLKLIRGEKTEFADGFAGFSLAFLQLFLVGLVSSILTTVGLLFCIIPGVYLGVAWSFALPLVMDKRMEFWPAMELSRKVVQKHWWTFFGLGLVCLLLLFVGLALCCIGVYVALPLAFGATAYAYEDVFGTKRPPAG